MKDERNTETQQKRSSEITAELSQESNNKKFELGRLYFSPGVIDRVDITDLATALQRHEHGDWGDVCQEDWQSNDRALRYEMRILSTFHGKTITATDQEADLQTQAKTKFWIITEADRSSTTLLLPSEY